MKQENDLWKHPALPLVLLILTFVVGFLSGLTAREPLETHFRHVSITAPIHSTLEHFPLRFNMDTRDVDCASIRVLDEENQSKPVDFEDCGTENTKIYFDATFDGHKDVWIVYQARR